MDQNTIIYLAVSSAIVLLVVAAAPNFGIIGVIIELLAVVAIVAVLLIAFADFIIVPFITRSLKISISAAKNYTMTHGMDAMVKYSNGIYYATGYLTANIYNYVFAEEQEVEAQNEMIAAPDKWERAVMNIHFPFKFNVITASEDIQSYREELEAKRGLLEFQFTKETQSSNPNSMALDSLQRQINVIQTRIDRIGEGEKPLIGIMFIESTAVGVSVKDASDNLANQLNELQTIFNVFDLSIMRIAGRELYLLFKMNYLVPGVNELVDSFQLQK